MKFIILLLSTLNLWGNVSNSGYQSALALNARPKLGANFTHLPQANPHAVKGGSMKMGVIGTFDAIFPYPFKGIPCYGNGITDEAMVYEKLMFRQQGEPFTLYAWLAEGVKIDPEYKWIEFKINSHAKWADGKPVTAEDLIFTVDALKEQSRPIFKNILKPVEKVEKISQNVVRIYVAPTAHPIEVDKKVYSKEQILVLCNLPVLPKHLLEGKKFDDLAQEKILGSGPYEIEDVKMGASVTYRLRKDYWGASLPINVGRHNVEKIKYIYFRDPNVTFEALKAGEIDIMNEDDATRRKAGYVFDRFKSGDVVLSILMGNETPGINGFIMNTRQQPLDRLALRKALTFALDFQWLNKNLYDTKYKRSLSFFGKEPFAATEGTLSEGEKKIFAELKVDQKISSGKLPEVSIDQSKKRRTYVMALLKEAGFTIKNGKCVDVKTNKTLEIDILVENNNTQKEVVAYARQLKQNYGIILNIRKMDTAQFWQRVMSFDFPMVSLQWSGLSSPGIEQKNRWTQESVDRKGSLNWAGVRDPNVDLAINHLLVATSLEEQAAATKVIDRLLRWGYYIVPLGGDVHQYALHAARLKYPENVFARKVVLAKSFWWDKTGGKE